MTKKKYDPLQRILHIHALLAQNRRPTIASLSAEFGVDARTVKRDIAYLRRTLSAPIKLTRNPLGYHYRQPFTLDPSPFDKHELLALSLVKQMRHMTQHTPFYYALKHAIDKILQRYDPHHSSLLLSHVSLREVPVQQHETEQIIYFNQLLEAIHAGTQVRMRYYTMGRHEENERIVDPQWLYYHDEHWYLLAHCHTRHTVRRFSLSRIRSLQPLSSPGRKLDYEEIMYFLYNTFSSAGGLGYQATIWFDADAALRVREHYWTPNQHIVFPQGENGPCLLTVQVDSLSLLLHELLPYGRHMRPLHPPELVTLWRKEISSMYALLHQPVDNSIEEQPPADKMEDDLPETSIGADSSVVPKA